MTTESFAEIATGYARDVAEGRELACKWVILACQRHLDNLARAHAGWRYVFNPELEDKSVELRDRDDKPFYKKYFPAERVCKFAELMPHVKGDWAARRDNKVKLERWQVFILASVFGWIDKTTLKRRFRIVDVFVPRKNGKSFIGAVIGLYMFAVDGEFGAEVYSGATSEYQAYEVFGPARLMAKATPEFQQKYGITVNISNLAIAGNNSKFEPVIGKPGDGASPSCAIVDEYHEHKTPALYETMNTGMGARSQPLLVVITTAGSDIAGPCYMHQMELQNILQGLIENELRFGIIFTIDDLPTGGKEPWATELAMRKANPNFGVSVNAEFLAAQVADAVANARKQNTVKTKHFNIWVAAASPWLNLDKLQQCADPTLRLEDFAGEHGTAGLDLASKNDIASRCLLFRHQVEGDDEFHYTAFWRSYVPEAAVKLEENKHYEAWVKTGCLTQTDGNMINLKQIEEDLVADSEKSPLDEIAFDAWGAREMAPSLAEEGFEVVDIPMNVKYLSEPMKKLQVLVDGGRFHYNGDEAATWMLSNVEVKPDRNENIFPRKAKAANKIDAAVSLIVAMARAMVAEPEPDPEGVLYV